MAARRTTTKATTETATERENMQKLDDSLNAPAIENVEPGSSNGLSPVPVDTTAPGEPAVGGIAHGDAMVGAPEIPTWDDADDAELAALPGAGRPKEPSPLFPLIVAALQDGKTKRITETGTYPVAKILAALRKGARDHGGVSLYTKVNGPVVYATVKVKTEKVEKDTADKA